MVLRCRVLMGASLTLGLLGALAAPASAASISGTTNGLSWTAASDIIGQTSTATVASGGNPIYAPVRPFQNGVGAIILNEGAAGNFICSGSLLADRIHVLTAGHCVSKGNGTITPISASVTFYGGSNPDAVVGTLGAAPAGGLRIAAAGFSVNPLYTGNVIDEHDVAIITLAQKAPEFLPDGSPLTAYKLYTTGGDLVGQNYNIAGYGGRSDQGGSVGVDLGTGRLRQGTNRYDFMLGDAVFGGVLNSAFFGENGNTTKHSYIADFDNGLPGQDASCGLYEAFGYAPDYATGGKFCNLGTGATEVSTAGGDSGGPQFVNGQLASVTSYGLTFGTQVQPGDIDNKLNDTFGELNGFVSTRFNSGYINSVADVPEPASWALMIAGFGLVGAVARRRRGSAVAA